MRTCGPMTVPAPITTCAPMTAYGPTTTSEAREASAWMTADSARFDDIFRLLRAVRHHAQHLSLGDDGPVDPGRAFHLHRAGASLQHFALHDELITGNDRLAEARLVDAAEEEELLVALWQVHEEQHGRALRHRFHDQHARHHRRSRKMSLKELLIRRHVLEADDSFSRDRKSTRLNSSHSQISYA